MYRAVSRDSSTASSFSICSRTLRDGSLFSSLGYGEYCGVSPEETGVLSADEGCRMFHLRQAWLREIFEHSTTT